LHDYISVHVVSPSHLCMHVLKLNLILHRVVFTADTTLFPIFFHKEYSISFDASCIEYSLILVKLIFPNNIHTNDKK
jgi:hypothetical protein